jgi:hypothetical protein
VGNLIGFHDAFGGRLKGFCIQYYFGESEPWGKFNQMKIAYWMVKGFFHICNRANGFVVYFGDNQLR